MKSKILIGMLILIISLFIIGCNNKKEDINTIYVPIEEIKYYNSFLDTIYLKEWGCNDYEYSTHDIKIQVMSVSSEYDCLVRCTDISKCVYRIKKCQEDILDQPLYISGNSICNEAGNKIIVKVNITYRVE